MYRILDTSKMKQMIGTSIFNVMFPYENVAAFSLSISK